MICSKCKTSNDVTALFCRECGAPQVTAQDAPVLQGSAAIGSASSNVATTVSLSDSDALVGRIIDGRYRIESKIGIGGMGTVYKGTRLLIGDQVAIKILHPEQTSEPEATERFRREAQAAARLKHSNAVSVYDFGVSQDGFFYLVVELVEGESVRSIIKQRGPFTPSASAEIITQVCAALDEAHRHQIIHRDIKPDNIMVHHGADGLRVKVLDFGIAKLQDQSATNLTRTGSVMGTPHYMSPEQCLGEELDPRSDIYSLGIVLYEMLAGIVPFNSPTSTAVVVQHVNQSPPPLRAINMSISPAVEAVVLRALEKRREARPQTAGALAQELNAAVNIAPSNPSTIQTAVSVTPTSAQTYLPTMVMTPTPPSGSYVVSPPVSHQTGKISRGNKNNLLLVLISILTVILLGGIGYLLLSGQGKQDGPLPDHYGIFIRNKNSLSELRREEFNNVIQGRDEIVNSSILPAVSANPTVILYSEGQDIPVNDLKLLQLDAIDATGKISYWNYQVSPVGDKPGMKQIKVSGGLPAGRYAFALISGYIDEGNHKLWPFQVDEGGSSETPQSATLPLKPKPSTVSDTAPRTTPSPSAATTPPPLPPPPNAAVAFCTENNVVLRGAPNLNGEKIGRLSKGQRLWIIELSSNYDTWRGITANWAYVQPENSSVRGWVFTYFVSR